MKITSKWRRKNKRKVVKKSLKWFYEKQSQPWGSGACGKRGVNNFNKNSHSCDCGFISR